MAFVMDEAFFSDELLKKDWKISFNKSDRKKANDNLYRYLRQ